MVYWGEPGLGSDPLWPIAKILSSENPTLVIEYQQVTTTKKFVNKKLY